MRGTLRCKLTGTTYKGRKIHSADTVFGINVKEEELAKTGNGHQ
jgi:hypothetical protein